MSSLSPIQSAATNDLSPSVILQKSNDGKSIKASIVQYFGLTSNERNLMTSAGPSQETIFRKILRKKLLLTSGNSSSIKVAISTDDKVVEELFFKRKDFAKLAYNPERQALECTSNAKEVNLTVFTPNTSHRHNVSAPIPRLDTVETHTPPPLGTPTKYKVDIYSASGTSDTSSVYTLESSEDTVLTSAELNLTLPHRNYGPHDRSVSSRYPSLSILYLDIKHSVVTGYFSLNKGHLFPNLSPIQSPEVNLRKIGKSPSILMTEDTISIDEISVTISDPHVSFYKFEHSYTPGVFEYSLEVSVNNDEVLQAHTAIQEAETFLNLQTTNFHNTPANLEKMGLLFNSLQTLLGSTPVKGFEGIFDNSINPQALASDVFEYIRTVSKMLEKVYLFFRKPAGELAFSSYPMLKRDVKLHHRHQSPSIENIFNNRHTEADFRARTSSYLTQLGPLPFSIKYEGYEPTDEQVDYSMEKADALRDILGIEKKYEVKAYMLKSYQSNPRDNAILMKHPKWIKIEPETEIPDNSFVRAVISCSDGTQHEEYFIIGD